MFGASSALFDHLACLLGRQVQQSVTDLSRFQRTVKLVAFQPFTSAENALENMNAVSEHALTDDLKNFLELKLGKSKKKKNVELGVGAPQLGTAIQETLGISCKSDEVTREVIRGIRMHFNRFIKELDNGMLEKAQLGLGHSYSRAKVCVPRAGWGCETEGNICLRDGGATSSMKTNDYLLTHDAHRFNYSFTLNREDRMPCPFRRGSFSCMCFPGPGCICCCWLLVVPARAFLNWWLTLACLWTFQQHRSSSTLAEQTT